MGGSECPCPRSGQGGQRKRATGCADPCGAPWFEGRLRHGRRGDTGSKGNISHKRGCAESLISCGEARQMKNCECLRVIVPSVEFENLLLRRTTPHRSERLAMQRGWAVLLQCRQVLRRAVTLVRSQPVLG